MSTNIVNEKIGANIQKARKEKGLTQKELGAMMGICKSTIEKYEKGTIDIQTSRLIRLSEIFGNKCIMGDLCKFK